MNQSSSKTTRSEAVQMEPITLDCEHVLTHAGGDPGRLVQLCVNFLSEIPLHMESMHSAIQGSTITPRDHLKFQRSLQQLRTCLMVFGSGQLFSTAKVLEQAVCHRRPRQAQREWERLECQLQLLIPQVQRLMLEMSSPCTAVQ